MSGKAKAKMVPMDPNSLGFGQVPGLARNRVDGTDSWASQEDGGSRDSLKGRTTDAYSQMMETYRNAVDDKFTPSAMAGLYAYNPRTKTWKTYLASVVKRTYMNLETSRPANGPLVPMHPTLNAVVGANAHRTGFACAEMHALNNMLYDANPLGDDPGLKIKGLMVTKGTPDKNDKGEGGGKATMVPCLSGPGVMGCGDVLTALGVEF